jgi:flagellar biosynthesis protein FliQ
MGKYLDAHVARPAQRGPAAMNEGDVLEIVRSGLYTSLVVAGPALAGALLTGVAISILQALTQVQEMTLANIPKIFMTLLLVMLFLPLSFAAMRSYMDQIMQMVVRI